MRRSCYIGWAELAAIAGAWDAALVLVADIGFRYFFGHGHVPVVQLRLDGQVLLLCSAVAADAGQAMPAWRVVRNRQVTQQIRSSRPWSSS